MIVNLPILHRHSSDNEVRNGVRSLLSQLRDVLVHYRAAELNIRVPEETQEEHHSKIKYIDVELSPTRIHFRVETPDYISTTEADLAPDGDVFLHRPPTLETRHVEKRGNRKTTVWITPDMPQREGWPSLQKHDFMRLYRGLQKLSHAALPAIALAPHHPDQEFEVRFRFQR